MLFVAEYEFTWEMLEAVIAKRMEWDTEKPDDFRFVGEYVWQDHDPPFRGVVIVEAGSVDALNAFALHYGPTLKVKVHPASDVVAALHSIGNVRAAGKSPSAPQPRRRRAQVNRRRRKL